MDPKHCRTIPCVQNSGHCKSIGIIHRDLFKILPSIRLLENGPLRYLCSVVASVAYFSIGRWFGVQEMLQENEERAGLFDLSHERATYAVPG